MSRYVLSPRGNNGGGVGSNVLRYIAVPNEDTQGAASASVEADVVPEIHEISLSPTLRRRNSAEMVPPSSNSPRFKAKEEMEEDVLPAPDQDHDTSVAEVSCDPILNTLEDATGNLNVRVLDLNGKVFLVRCSGDWTVDRFKAVVHSKSLVVESRQRLIYRGRVLEGSSTLDDYKVEDGHTIHLFVRQLPSSSEDDDTTRNATVSSASGSNNGLLESMQGSHRHLHFGAVSEYITSAVFPSDNAHRNDPLMQDTPLGVAARRVKLWASFVLIIHTMKLLGEVAFQANLHALQSRGRSMDPLTEKGYMYSPLYDRSSYVTACKLATYAWGVYIGCIGFKAAHHVDLRPIRNYCSGLILLAALSILEQTYEIFHFSQWDPYEYELLKAKTQMYAQQRPSLQELIRSSVVQGFLLVIMWSLAVKHAFLHKEAVMVHNQVLAAAAMSAVPLPSLESIAAGNIEDPPQLRPANDTGTV